MAKKIIRNIPLNRVEGDLEIRVEINDGVVTDAWSSGTMFRGFERILVGRGALDGLVITPRICGLCNLCHLTAASRALDQISGVSVPGNAVRVRNLVQMTEHIQSDIRHGFLMFLPDFTNPVYKDHPLYEEAVRRFTPFKGETVVATLQETKKALEMVAILGGQWPHTSFMVPGGIVSLPSETDLLDCRQVLAQYRRWYETRVLGCSLERWQDVRSTADLEAWLEEKASQRESDLGFYVRFARAAGLHTFGKGCGNFISYGAFDLPEGTEVVSLHRGTKFVPAGFTSKDQVQMFDQGKVAEHVSHSWFEPYEGGKHPFEGETKPYATGHEGERYSWCKAPRYDGKPAETGPLAEMVIGEHPLIMDLTRKEGPSVFVRELARLIRPAEVMPAMETWLKELQSDGSDFYRSPGEIQDGEGFGFTEAARGALGHWVRIREGKIAHYQIITPTAWNGSPRDSNGVRGPWEEALVGTPVRDIDNPVELGHVIRSYDACLVCTVHSLHRGRSLGRIRI
ncbi:MAG: nickel-dependent hydrogenase large subunit [Planctomycetota bacterium]|jgi:hydrogenase large subunit